LSTTIALPSTCLLSSSFGEFDLSEVIFQSRGGSLEPEIRQRRQHRPLTRNRIGQYHVESRDTVAGNDQKLPIADGIDIAHLTFVN